MQTPPINCPAHGWVPVVGVDVVVGGGAVVVVVVGFVVVVGGAVVVVVAGFVVVVGGAVVVVVAGFVVVVGGAVVVVVAGFVVVVGAVVVVVDEPTGDTGSVDGTQSPKPASLKRRVLGATCAAKQTRSVGPTVVGCVLDGEQSSRGSPTCADRPLTVTGNGGVNRVAFGEG